VRPETPPDSVDFPRDFLWGAATAAYQIEGSPLADGAGESAWHRFAHTPGRTANGETGDVACDHYRRAPEDVGLIARLGLGAYRFSVAWGRVLPEGTGAVNRAGLGFYDRLVDLLLERGITPMVTLYHWDLPAALDDRGGWCNPDIARWFAEYAAVMFRALGDRVPMWVTLNEPWVVADAGYLRGVHAPGHRSIYEAPRAAHQLLRAHAGAVRVFRAGGHPGRIGLVVNLEPKDPASDAPADLEATARAEAYMNRQYLDPVYLGAYPAELPAIFGDAWPAFPDPEMEEIREPGDFLGVNYYTRGVMRHDDANPPVRASHVPQAHALRTETGWEVHPESLLRILRWVRERYGPVPLYVTENGAAYRDPPTAIDGRVDDPLRVDYLRTHLRAVRQARREGIDLRGYFVWSLLDNYEWASGYAMRFGMVHVNYATQVRTPKSSAFAYRAIRETRGAALDLPLGELLRAAEDLRAGE
jgi:beta-glucosidase